MLCFFLSLYLFLLKTDTYYSFIISVLAVFFGGLAISTLRMKYLWTPYMCILASFGISDFKMWKTVLTQFKTQGTMVSKKIK